MSRAFVKDDDGGEGIEELPDRLISPHPNLVTADGLAMIDAEVEKFATAYAEAQTSGDRNALQRVARDLRYWSARRASAEVQPVPPEDGRVHFGCLVTIEFSDGSDKSYRIVGEDEANPAQGSISYVSPLAQNMMGKALGDAVRAGSREAAIVGIG